MGYQNNNDDDGVFWMCWEDFKQVWMEITVCARSTDASDLAFDVHEDLGCAGKPIAHTRTILIVYQYSSIFQLLVASDGTGSIKLYTPRADEVHEVDHYLDHLSPRLPFVRGCAASASYRFDPGDMHKSNLGNTRYHT